MNFSQSSSHSCATAARATLTRRRYQSTIAEDADRVSATVAPNTKWRCLEGDGKLRSACAKTALTQGNNSKKIVPMEIQPRMQMISGLVRSARH